MLSLTARIDANLAISYYTCSKAQLVDSVKNLNMRILVLSFTCRHFLYP
jgi:hypothetical protein